jgi:hypothetical protein
MSLFSIQTTMLREETSAPGVGPRLGYDDQVIPKAESALLLR